MAVFPSRFGILRYLVFVLCAWTRFHFVRCDVARQYKLGEMVPVSINTVGPYRNPNEKYSFFNKVPFCSPSSGDNKLVDREGSVFMGDRAVQSDYKLPFAENMNSLEVVCAMTLDQNAIKKYREMIAENYMFSFLVDHKLLVTGFLGKEEVVGPEDDAQKSYFLFTHWNFHCEYNGNYVG